MKNKLPPEVIKNSGGAVLTLRKERFIEFIGGYEEGLQSKLLKIFKRSK
jgi:hypothetical protein